MLNIKIKKKERIINLRFVFKLGMSFKEINSNRLFDDDLKSTFIRISTNINNNLKDDSKIDYSIISLQDIENKLVPLETKNIDAWKQDYIFKIKEQEFKVFVNLPAVKKIAIPKILIAGMPALVKIEFESDEKNQDVMNKNSLFKWYTSDKVYEPVELIDLENDKKTKKPEINMNEINWNLIEEGISKKFIILNGNTENKLVKVECYPRDGKREGLAVEAITSSPVLKSINKENMPMTERHKYTQNRLDSDLIRVVSYNILAKSNSDRNKKEYYYCPEDILDYNYRKILLLNEIIHYNADFLFLQECENHFLEELENCLPDYKVMFKQKEKNINDGEMILFRSDRFEFVKSYDICLANELNRNKIFKNLKLNLQKFPYLFENVVEKGTILQIVHIKSIEAPEKSFLLLNTHLYFHHKASFTRLIQAIVSLKFTEELCKTFTEDSKPKIMFGGDFNSIPSSSVYNYITKSKFCKSSLSQDEQEIIKNCEEEIKHSINFKAYTNYKFTSSIRETQALIDYVFYEADSFEFVNMISLPPIKKIKEFVSLPNKYIPSDHLALVFEFKIK